MYFSKKERCQSVAQNTHRISAMHYDRLLFLHIVAPVYKWGNHSFAVRHLPDFMHFSCAMTKSCVTHDQASLLVGNDPVVYTLSA